MSGASDVPTVQRLRSWLGLAVLLMLGLLAAAGFQSYRDLAEVRAREAGLVERIEAAEERLEHFDLELARIHDDPVTLERLAREELGMVRPDDVVIILPETEEP